MAISPDLVVSKSAVGIAPQFVHFDLTGTTSTEESSAPDAFRNLFYVGDFDDAASESVPWGYGNPLRLNTRNEGRGPVQAHVYEQAGTYNPAFAVYDVLGNVEVVSEEVVIYAPDDTANVGTTLSGSNVIAVNNTGDSDFSEAPAGATTYNASDDLTTALGQLSTTKKHIVLKRGGEWTDSGGFMSTLAGRVIVGAYGTGARPILTSSVGDFVATINIGNLTNWSFSDLDIRTTGDWAAVDNRNGNGNTNQVLFLRCRLDGTGNKFGILIDEFAGSTVHELNAIVDCECLGSYSIFMSSNKSAVLGTLSTLSGTIQNFRTHGFIHSVMAHNTFNGQNSGFDLVKFGSTENPASPDHWESLHTEYSVIADNIMEDTANAGRQPILTCGPESFGNDERLKYCLIERNWIKCGADNNFGIAVFDCLGFRIQNNIVDYTNGNGYQPDSESVFCFTTGSRSAVQESADNEFFNNTGWKPGTIAGSGAVVGLRFGSDGGNTNHGANNLFLAPDESNDSILDEDPTNTVTTNTSDAEMDTAASSVFVDSTPDSASDFAILNTSFAYGSGTAIKVFDDYAGNIRDWGGTYDKGAFAHADHQGTLPGGEEFVAAWAASANPQGVLA